MSLAFTWWHWKKTRFLLLTFCCSVLQFSAFSLWSFGRKVFSRRAPAIARGWKFKDQRKIFGVFIHKFCAFRPVAFDFLASFPKFWWNFSLRQCQNGVEKLRAKSQQNVVHPPSKFGIHRKNEKMFHESRFFLWLSARRWEPQHLPFSCFVSCALEAFFFPQWMFRKHFIRHFPMSYSRLWELKNSFKSLRLLTWIEIAYRWKLISPRTIKHQINDTTSWIFIHRTKHTEQRPSRVCVDIASPFTFLSLTARFLNEFSREFSLMKKNKTKYNTAKRKCFCTRPKRFCVLAYVE